MSVDPLEELLQFIKLDSRLDLKHISLDHLLGLSGNVDGLSVLLKNRRIIQSIIDLTGDKVEEVSKNALLTLVNVTASGNGATELLTYKSNSNKSFLLLMISYVLDSTKRDADAACMILSNVTRVQDNLEQCIDTILPHLNDILNVFVNTDFNKKGSNLNYLAPMFANLSCSDRIREWLTKEDPHVPLIKLLPFCNYDRSNVRKGGVLSLIKNLSFSVEYHMFLLQPDLDLLSYLLTPLMGNEDYEDSEMDVLPITLQYLPKEKQRDPDPDIRRLVLETLNRLCAKCKPREILRSNGVFYVLREYHKWEKDPHMILACENVVDILIQTEKEVGVEDLTSIEVPDDMIEKFAKMDEDFIKNVD